MIEFESPSLTAAPGSIVGVIAESGGVPRDRGGARHIGPDEPLPEQPGDFILRFPFSRSCAVDRARGISRLLDLRRAGGTFVLITHDEPLLEGCADEIWWLRDGALVARGEPLDVLDRYRAHIAKALRAAGADVRAEIALQRREGDGRAVLEGIDLLDEAGTASTVFRSGEPMSIRARFRYHENVPAPVIGIMIRTRIGLNVYGTNTELEKIDAGPVSAGDFLIATFRFVCDLCPGDYTVTVASHDPDGLWHDWREDAVAFAVADERYTAGVANLRARVTVEHRR
ncbi:MAG TPA: Wzt carbohydrate-binding domain-containing protein [Bryobacteraceae bacterium]|nr:Wzt carbohydrate-binding domain-containing protein [Bryobacteraceae bacterium]